MLINGERALAYTVTIDEIKPIPNYDRVEHARVGGWWCIVQKGQFNVGDKALYIEVDSLVPEKDERFAFLEQRHYKVKTLKMCKVYSQGLIMPLDEFPELKDKEIHTDVTKTLGIKYYVAEDNARKAKTNPNAKYNNMCARNKKLAQKRWWKWLMKRLWGRKLLFIFFGRKNDNPKKFPEWIKKTDEDRIENCMWMLDNKDPFVCSEKINGTSSTFFIDYTKSKRKPEFGVCSRNVRQVDMNQDTYFDCQNVYWEMALKYGIEDALKSIAKKYGIDRVVLQGETYGESVQGNPYKLDERRLAAFNLIFNGERLGSLEAKSILDKYDIPFVPIIDETYILPDSEDFEEFKKSADGMSTINKQTRREGFVYRSQDGQQSFKNISRNYLLKLKD